MFFQKMKCMLKELNRDKNTTEEQDIFKGIHFAKNEAFELKDSLDDFDIDEKKQLHIPTLNDYRNLKSVTISYRNQFFAGDARIDSVSRIKINKNDSIVSNRSNSHLDDLKSLAKNFNSASRKVRRIKTNSNTEILVAAKNLYKQLRIGVYKTLSKFLAKLKVLKVKKSNVKDSKILYAKVTEIKSLDQRISNQKMGARISYLKSFQQPDVCKFISR